MLRVTKTLSGIYAVDMGDDLSNVNDDELKAIDILVEEGDPVLIAFDLEAAEEFFDSEVTLVE